MTETQAENEPVIIKKYANRRLYNTETSSYVTLDHLAELVRKGRDFVVRDAKSGEDITRQVLAQIIFEQEGKGVNLLPIPLLRQLIGYYGDQMAAMVPSYLLSSMQAFTRQQESMKKMFAGGLAPTDALSIFDELARQNMAAFERGLGMLGPFAGKAGGSTGPGRDKAGGADDKIAALERQLATMQEQLAELRRE